MMVLLLSNANLEISIATDRQERPQAKSQVKPNKQNDELAEFLSRCKLLISNDSGPVHVAVAMLTPVVDIFGRGDPGLSFKRWGPLGDHDIVLHKDVGCEVCQAHNCRLNFACIKKITVEEVVSSAEKILGPPEENPS